MAPAGQIVTDFAIARINLIPGAHAIVERLRGGQTLLLYRDPKDQFDPDHAIMVVVPAPGSKRKVGYLPSGLAKELAPLMDAGVNIIARKAPNPLYGVCQVAYIPPVAELAPAPVAPLAEVDTPVLELQVPKTTPVAVELPEGVTQHDIDTATDMPPLGDSRRPRAQSKEYPDDEPTADTTRKPG